LPPPPNLLPATRASPESDWFASHRFFHTTYRYTLQQLDRSGCTAAYCLVQNGVPENTE